MKLPAYFEQWARNNLEHYENAAYNPLGPGLIFCFPYPCLLATLRKNGWTDFHEIFKIFRRWHNKISGVFHGPHNRSGIMSVSNIMQGWMNAFSWNYQESSTLTQETNQLEHFQDVVFNPLDTGSFLMFWSMFVFLHYGGWMDFHEIIRVILKWHKKQLAKMFHVEFALALSECFLLSTGFSGTNLIRFQSVHNNFHSWKLLY